MIDDDSRVIDDDNNESRDRFYRDHPNIDIAGSDLHKDKELKMSKISKILKLLIKTQSSTVNFACSHYSIDLRRYHRIYNQQHNTTQ